VFFGQSRNEEDFLRVHWLDGEETRNQEVAKWLAERLHAIGVIQGSIELLSDGQVKLLLRVVGLGPVRVIEARLAASTDFHDLFDQAASSFAPEPEKIDEEPGTYKVGDAGIVMPHGACVYCPNPDYTDPARKAKYQGTVQLSAILGTDGRLSAIKVIKYAPFDLTDRAIEAVRTWHMKPCEKDGKPVAARVPVEITFRLLSD
jgi:TonB family protein